MDSGRWGGRGRPDGCLSLPSPGRPVSRRQHRGDTRRLGGAQAGTEIVRVLHAVEDEDEGIRLVGEERGEITLVVGADVVVGAGVAVLTGDGWSGVHGEGGSAAVWRCMSVKKTRALSMMP